MVCSFLRTHFKNLFWWHAEGYPHTRMERTSTKGKAAPTRSPSSVHFRVRIDWGSPCHTWARTQVKGRRNDSPRCCREVRVSFAYCQPAAHISYWWSTAGLKAMVHIVHLKQNTFHCIVLSNTMEFYSAVKKQENFTFCNGVDGPEEHYAKWNKPGRERQIPYDFTHMWNRVNKLN